MKYGLFLIALVALLIIAAPASAQSNPCNPCGKAKNACNPCGTAKNACNPCAKNPCNPCGGMPAVNPCYAKYGKLFIIDDPMKRNTVTFRSSAPLEDIVGTSNQVKGYLVFDPKNPYRGIRGDFKIPVSSLDTGIKMRDEHLRGAEWLDAKKYPYIRFRIDGTKNVRLSKEGAGFETYDVTFTGVLTIHGKSKLMNVPGKVSFLPESKMTRSKMPGDLLAGRATFKVSLKDFGIKGFAGVVGSKVSDSIEITVGLMGSTKKAGGANACNPCGCNPCAKNACNPCGKNACNPCGKNACNPCAKNACNPCGKGSR